MYRVYFRNSLGIAGRQDFAADDDKTALQVAQALLEACSDVCSSFELWHGMRLVSPSLPAVEGVAEAIRDRTQAIVRDCEISISQSRWAIASSKELLARLNGSGGGGGGGREGSNDRA